MGIRRFIRKLFRCKPKYNGTPVAFYRKNDKGEWEKLSYDKNSVLSMYPYKPKKGEAGYVSKINEVLTMIGIFNMEKNNDGTN